MVAEAVSTRRTLDSERQIQETEEQRTAREVRNPQPRYPILFSLPIYLIKKSNNKDQVARRTAVQDEITNSLRAFYCSLCDKQFQTVAQYDEHTNSYAHHHKARFRDMQANARIKPQEDIDKRKEKERKREERELRKIAAAAGIKMPKVIGPQTGSAPPVLAPATPASDELATMDVDPGSLQRKGDWPSNSSISSTPSAPVPGFKKLGWTTVGSSSYDHFSQRPPSPQSNSSFGWAPAPTSVPSTITSESYLPPSYHTPSFRTGGWTSLDTGTATTVQSSGLMTIPPAPATIPVMPMTTSELPPSSEFPQLQPPIGGSRGGWSSISSKTATPVSTPLPLGPSSGPHSPLRQSSDLGAVNSTSSNPHVVLVSTPSQSLMKPDTPSVELERSGWQKFQSKNLKRR